MERSNCFHLPCATESLRNGKVGQRSVGLYKPVVMLMMDDAKGSNTVITESLITSVRRLMCTRPGPRINCRCSGCSSRARATNLRSGTIGFKLRNDHLESDLSELMILKNRHERRRQADRWTMTSWSKAEGCVSFASAHQHD